MTPTKICYQDEWLVVVDKPAGLPTQQGDTPDNQANLYTQLGTQFPYVGLHHRLDQATSGLLLFTLHPSMNKSISMALKNHSIQREYIAVLHGMWEYSEDQVQWTQDIGKQQASTHVQSVGSNKGMTAVKLSLQTGRTHQIRKHAALNGMPILGDRRYGEYGGRLSNRLALHAFRLTFAHPKTLQPMTICSDIPDALKSHWVNAGGELLL